MNTTKFAVAPLQLWAGVMRAALPGIRLFICSLKWRVYIYIYAIGDQCVASVIIKHPAHVWWMGAMESLLLLLSLLRLFFFGGWTSGEICVPCIYVHARRLGSLLLCLRDIFGALTNCVRPCVPVTASGSGWRGGLTWSTGQRSPHTGASLPGGSGGGDYSTRGLR